MKKFGCKICHGKVEFSNVVALVSHVGSVHGVKAPKALQDRALVEDRGRRKAEKRAAKDAAKKTREERRRRREEESRKRMGKREKRRRSEVATKWPPPQAQLEEPTRHCACCAREIPDRFWRGHAASVKHLRKLREARRIKPVASLPAAKFEEIPVVMPEPIRSIVHVAPIQRDRPPVDIGAVMLARRDGNPPEPPQLMLPSGLEPKLAQQVPKEKPQPLATRGRKSSMLDELDDLDARAKKCIAGLAAIK